MRPVSSYAFDSCTIVKAAREVWLEGSLQRTTPRVFDLLVYLIEHRSKVVARRELIDRVWGGNQVSHNAVARTVMQARAAIGDSGLEARHIRTVHRVGYRFVSQTIVGMSAQSSDAVDSLAPDPAVNSSKVRLALLPFENSVENDVLRWTEHGLLAMLTRALSGNDRFHVESALTVMHLLELVPSDATLEERAYAIGRLGGFDRVVCARVMQEGISFLLEYRLIGIGKSPRAGNFRSSELSLLAHQLVQAIELNLSTDQLPD